MAGPSDLISPLWSLQWEVIFSLLLPVYIAAVTLWPRLYWLKLIGAIGFVAVGAFGFSPALYLPMFAVGVLVAAQLNWFAGLGRRVSEAQGNRLLWGALTVFALLLLTAHWIAEGAHLPARAVEAMSPLILVGATLLILISAFCPEIRTALETRIVLWLGRISFSLYLIHEPIVIGLGYALGPHHAWLVLPLALAICLPLATMFFKVIEAPAHTLARRVGRTGIREKLPA